MKADRRITFRVAPDDPTVLFAHHVGSQRAARHRARRLLKNLRAAYPAPEVFLDGHRVNGEKQKEGSES